MSGSGNDFVFLDGRVAVALTDWTAGRIAAICARRTGVGADGLVILEPIPKNAHPNAVRFHYFNADGGRSDMCGNASLCATRLAVQLEMVSGADFTLMTDIGPLEVHCLDGPGERARIVVNDVSAPNRPNIPLISGEHEMLQYTVGIPHVVVACDDVDAPAADPQDRGKLIRHHPALGAAGANANFVSRTAGGTWRYRTFERGVEAETLACGTGAVAVAATLRHLGLTQADSVELITSSGKLLEVGGTVRSDGAVERPTLTGEGRLVYVGELTALEH